jgi:hypothetical protein
LGFVCFSDNFQRFLIFLKFWIFFSKLSSRDACQPRRMPHYVSAGLGLDPFWSVSLYCFLLHILQHLTVRTSRRITCLDCDLCSRYFESNIDKFIRFRMSISWPPIFLNLVIAFQ